jgi:hypothetical protein
VAIIKKELKLEMSLSSILQILSINVFSKEPLAQLLAEVTPQTETRDICNQLIFKY